MWMKQINRASPEQVFIAVKNEFTASMPVGHAVHWNFPITNAGTGTGNGYGVTFASTVATLQPSPELFAGVVAGNDISSGDYGVVQVYGYHPGVFITGGVDNGLFDSLFFSVTTRAAASFTNAILAPANAYGNTTGGVTNAGYMGVILPPVTLAFAETVAVSQGLAGLWRGGYAIPLGNLNEGATVTTNSSGSVKAFIKAL